MTEANNKFSGKKMKDNAPARITCYHCVHYRSGETWCPAADNTFSVIQDTCELFTPRQPARVLDGYGVVHATGETPQAALDNLSKKLVKGYGRYRAVPVGGATLLEFINRRGDGEWLAYQTLEAVSERADK